MVGPPTASELLALLALPAGLDSALLSAAEAYFGSRGLAPHARWMSLEREGYGAGTEVAQLRDILGEGSPPTVIDAVLLSRLRYGTVVVRGVPRQWPHFFVEPVDELRRWHQQHGAGGPALVRIDLGQPPGGLARPHSLAFPREVFADVLGSLAQEIGDAVRGTE